MRPWFVVPILVGCGGGVTAASVTGPDASPPIQEPSADASVEADVQVDAPVDAGPPDACRPPIAVADWCEVVQGTCGDAGMAVTCVGNGMVSWPGSLDDEHDNRIVQCEQTFVSDDGMKSDYCCPKTCIRTRRKDCSTCGAGRAMQCPSGAYECH